ncbi:hypothetical protein [Micromonospora sp. KC207]|uniref:hypothetical protein n=1 Tax=Micromonospora sp. KC207 TaxID=2530377 RepID=UPI00140464FB|nr:hypothetical protein [Micromonospora sp. KC207]
MARPTDPLAGLDQVPWESPHHAYGPAVDVPGHLRALRSAEAPSRRRVLSGLAGNVPTRARGGKRAVTWCRSWWPPPATRAPRTGRRWSACSVR